MRHQMTVLLGKSVKKAAELRGGGSALPGLVVEKVDPDFMRRTLSTLPHGVVLISGTNGKTTTTKMVVALLESQGLKVFTNRTGSNFTRGVAAALLSDMSPSGKLDADIAVLELDEAHAVHFVKSVSPTYTLLLNVMRDQLDRFGEIDATAELLRTIAVHTTKGIVINRDDPRLSSPAFIELLRAPIRTYGVAPSLRTHFPTDDTMRSDDEPPTSAAKPLLRDDTSLLSFSGQRAVIGYRNGEHPVELALRGIYNVQNATGAVALTRLVMGDALDETTMLQALSTVQPAFGRGESITVGDTTCEIVLVKNPSGFRLGLKSFDSKDADTMIAINDEYADGRDMSWLWDVEFDSLSDGVAMVSGSRAYDMALRLQYAEIDMTQVEPSLGKALETFLATGTSSIKRVYCTYTAMLAIRKHLAKIATVEVVR